MIENPGTNIEGGREGGRVLTRRDFLKLAAGALLGACLPVSSVEEESSKKQEIPYSPPKTPETKPVVIRKKISEGVFIEFSESERMSNGNKNIEVTIIFSEEGKRGNFF
jgi:hypothetical protein